MQNKYVMMIDAGYLFAEGSKLMFGGIVSTHINADNLVTVLSERIEDYFESVLNDSVSRRLRMYWYDAKDRSEWISRVPGITLRLGRLNKNNVQKGVDGAIIRDMLTLAHNGAVSDVFLMSGDEDLIEGVAEIKDLGISVHFLQIKTQIQNVSNMLFKEADGVIELTQEDFKTVMFSDRDTVAPPLTSGDHLLVEGRREAFEFMYPDIIAFHSVDEILAMRPQIPKSIDQLIFKQLKLVDSPTEVENQERRNIRAAFWQFILTQV